MKVLFPFFLLLVLSLQDTDSFASQTNSTETPTPCQPQKNMDSPAIHPLWMQIVGWSSTGLGFLSSLPAIYHVYRQKDVGGLSPVAFTVGTITVLLATSYNIALQNPILIAGSVWGLICNGLFFFAMYKFRKMPNAPIELRDVPDAI